MMSQLIPYPALGSQKQLRRTDTQDIDTWHRRMGHLNRKYISTLKSLADGMDFGTVRKHKLDCNAWVFSYTFLFVQRPHSFFFYR